MTCLLQEYNGQYCREYLDNIAELGGLVEMLGIATKRPIIQGFGGVAPKMTSATLSNNAVCNFDPKVSAKNILTEVSLQVYTE